MADETTNEKQALLVIGESGDYFAIPKEVMESHRLSEEERAQVDEALGDVEGFRMSSLSKAQGTTTSASQMLRVGVATTHVQALLLGWPPYINPGKKPAPPPPPQT